VRLVDRCFCAIAERLLLGHTKLEANILGGQISEKFAVRRYPHVASVRIPEQNLAWD
jgi:hypothetical protein